MQFFVGVTDSAWHSFLAALKPDEVNFWRPGGSTTFKAVPEGSPFLFKLHSPLNYIVGGGFFIRYETLPVSIAWAAFQEKNGASSLEELAGMIGRHRRDSAIDPTIGCVVLTDPFFFRQDDWIPIPRDWAPNIVTGKRYDTSASSGAALWIAVSERLARYRPDLGADLLVDAVRESPTGYGNLYLTRGRIGQGAFRVLVTGAYHRRCAITGERTLPVLEAAHIKPHALSGPNRVNNGLLLRSDLHILFDRGYLSISPDLQVRVSPAIREEYENGRDYYALAGRKLVQVPSRQIEMPNLEYLEWHNQNVFVA